MNNDEMRPEELYACILELQNQLNKQQAKLEQLEQWRTNFEQVFDGRDEMVLCRKLKKILAILREDESDVETNTSFGSAAHSLENREPRIEYRERIVKEEKIVSREVPPDWALQLNDLVTIAQSNPALASILLGDANSDKRVVRLLVCGSQWSNILRVWDTLAGQCKETQQEPGIPELNILKACVAFYNQTLQDCQAQIQSVMVGESYDYNQHQRANLRGDRIQSVLLPGLMNAAGDVTRPSLVLTT